MTTVKTVVIYILIYTNNSDDAVHTYMTIKLITVHRSNTTP